MNVITGVAQQSHVYAGLPMPSNGMNRIISRLEQCIPSEQAWGDTERGRRPHARCVARFK